MTNTYVKWQQRVIGEQEPRTYSGKVIGVVNTNFDYQSYLLVACTDGLVREVARLEESLKVVYYDQIQDHTGLLK